MTKHTLFVCKSCHRSSEERPEKAPFDGDILLDQLNTLCAQQFHANELKIQPVGCLWACNKGCVVSVSSHDKPTYVFANLLPEESPAPLLEFIQLYIKSRKGVLAWEQLPDLLQSASIAQIPPVKS
ncbi:MAG: DUF1636 family protein [Nostoc sp. DedQUE08]|uniref:DUF1636 family protein n=1 Tax=unclassified Nostoc TaxID=2593658 RepID=UPI002AD3A07C|nr:MULTISPECIES: DUF1636 family protein [unclassified Nostoc]MDZ8067327.1 DUF1636 family protein [Nostoc sp. DedQUE08]MDZ8091979.1 DUF1636 family protein [Nostoc sp. DedQUE05]